MVTTRNKANSCLFGSVSLANHDCKANSTELDWNEWGGGNRLEDIEVGKVITVFYDKSYFGEHNCEYVCKTCEVRWCSDLISADRLGFH
jgi:histone-lysine N-methyltransferase SUV420H